MRNTTSAAREQKLLLLAAFVCGLLHHWMFYGRTWGLQYPLFVLLLYSLYFWALRDRVRLRLEASSSLWIPVILLSLTFAVHANLLFLILNALAVPALMAVHTYWMSRPMPAAGLNARFIRELIEQVVVQTLRYIPEPFKVLFRGISERIQPGRSRILGKVLLGLLLSLPVLGVVVTLLSSADTVFNHTLTRLPEWLDVSWGLALFRTVWVAAVSIFLFAYLWGLLYPKPPFGRQGNGDPEKDWAALRPYPLMELPRMDWAVAATLLVVLNGVYLLFTVIQFSYFFGGGAAELPDGTTYAAYARKGFAELVVVTLINFTVLLTVIYGLDRRQSAPAALTAIRILLTVLIGATFVMLASAFLRLSMYEEAYGYTMTRLLVHAFMLFLVVLFLLALWKVWSDGAALLRWSLAAGLAAYVILNYVQVEAMIIQGNVQRYARTGQLDAEYFKGLSYEAVPYLLEVRRMHPEVPGIAEALDSFRSRLTREPEASWLEWNAAEWRAARVLNP